MLRRERFHGVVRNPRSKQRGIKLSRLFGPLQMTMLDLRGVAGVR